MNNVLEKNPEENKFLIDYSSIYLKDIKEPRSVSRPKRIFNQTISDAKHFQTEKVIPELAKEDSQNRVAYQKVSEIKTHEVCNFIFSKCLGSS